MAAWAIPDDGRTAMDLLLINLCLRYESPRYIPPVGIGYIGLALKEAGYAFDVLDLDRMRPSEHTLRTYLSQKKYDAYLMGCIVTGYKWVKQIAHLIRELNPAATIVAGNSVADSIPELLLKNTEVDIAVVGEGDVTVVELMDALSGTHDIKDVPGICFIDHDEITATEPRPLIKNLNCLKYIDWDIFDIEFYLNRSANLANDPCPLAYADRVCMSVPTARGCMYACTFCYHVFCGRGYRYRSARSILEEMIQLKENYNVNYINFWDELTFPHVKHCEETVTLLLEKKLGIFWNATIRGDLLRRKDKPLAEKMKAAGCVGLTYSLESANQQILRSMNKKLDLNNFLEQKYLLDEVGIKTWTNIVIGYPEETEVTLQETLDFCCAHNMYPSAGYLLPQPGTPIYEYARSNGYITNEEEYLLNIGDRQDLHINLSQMDDDTMTAITQEGLNRINKKLGLGIDPQSLLKTTTKKDAG